MHYFYFFNDTATTEISTLSLHDALPICAGEVDVPGLDRSGRPPGRRLVGPVQVRVRDDLVRRRRPPRTCTGRSEEHTSELQSRQYLVCRLLLEKKKIN